MKDFILSQLLTDDEMGFQKEWISCKQKNLNANKDDWSWPYESNKASDKQIGGSHYKTFVIQPAEFCYKNNIPYLEATAIKYLCRWKDKGGIQDLDKAIHFIELLKEYTSASNSGGTKGTNKTSDVRDGLNRFTSPDD